MPQLSTQERIAIIQGRVLLTEDQKRLEIYRLLLGREGLLDKLLNPTIHRSKSDIKRMQQLERQAERLARKAD